MEDKRDKIPVTPIPGAVESEGDPLGFMDPHGFKYSSESSMDLVQPLGEGP